MNRGLSEKLKAAFPSVVPVDRPVISNQEIPDPKWLAGFTSAEGCFFIKNLKSNLFKLGETILLEFKLSRSDWDEQLMRNLVKYFDCGNIFKNRNAFDFKVTKTYDIVNKIIPFFKEYPILGVKTLDFADFCQVAELMKYKAHLTKEGLEQIKKIKAGMNTGRK